MGISAYSKVNSKNFNPLTYDAISKIVLFEENKNKNTYK
jgi:hypothetical protein